MVAFCRQLETKYKSKRDVVEKAVNLIEKQQKFLEDFKTAKEKKDDNAMKLLMRGNLRNSQFYWYTSVVHKYL